MVLLRINQTRVQPQHLPLKLVQLAPQGQQAVVVYGELTSFRDIVFGFKSNGSMTNKLFDYISAETVQELRGKQPAEVQQATQGNDEVLLTLVAVKILNQFFANEKKLWALVAKKA